MLQGSAVASRPSFEAGGTAPGGVAVTVVFPSALWVAVGSTVDAGGGSSVAVGFPPPDGGAVGVTPGVGVRVGIV